MTWRFPSYSGSRPEGVVVEKEGQASKHKGRPVGLPNSDHSLGRHPTQQALTSASGMGVGSPLGAQHRAMARKEPAQRHSHVAIGAPGCGGGSCAKLLLSNASVALEAGRAGPGSREHSPEALLGGRAKHCLG